MRKKEQQEIFEKQIEEKQKLAKEEEKDLILKKNPQTNDFLVKTIEPLKVNDLQTLNLRGNLSFLSLTQLKQIITLEIQEQQLFLNH